MVTKKVTLTVPDELHEKMKKWGRKFNYSRLFQETVSQEIAKKELFQEKIKEDKSLGEIWEQASFEAPDGGFEVGREMGFVYAKTSPYSEIKALEEFIPAWDKKDRERIEVFHYTLDIDSILYRLGILGEPEKIKLTKDGKMPKKLLRQLAKSKFSLPTFEWGFMTGVMEYLKEEVGNLEVSFLVDQRDKKITKAKSEQQKMEILKSYEGKFKRFFAEQEKSRDDSEHKRK